VYTLRQMSQLIEEFAHFRPILTAVVVVLFFIVLAVGERWARKLSVSAAQRRRASQAVRAAATLLLLGLLVAIWAAKLKSVGLVISGFAVALIVASKELIMCATGWWVKTSGGAFRIGERIVVKGVRGDVIDYGIMTTTLLEVPTDADTPSGTIIVLPNSAFLNEPIRNETREASLTTSILQAASPAGVAATEALSMLEAAVASVWSALPDAQKDQARVEERDQLDAPTVPLVRVRRVEKDTAHFEVELPQPGRRARRLEDAILRDYLARLAQAKTSSAVSSIS
jgi:small-conductance mechanosensitive channel